MILKNSLFASLIFSIFLMTACGEAIKNNIPQLSSKTQSNDSIVNSFLLKDGDIVLRKGRSIESRAVMMADGNGDYSHVGIVVMEYGKAYVIHIVPDSSEKTIDYALKESINRFFTYKYASIGCVLRPIKQFEDISIKAAESALNYYNNKVSFDGSYDLKTNNQMYCTELVWKAYSTNKLDLIDGKLSTLHLPNINNRVILPSSILNSVHLKNIYYF